MFVVDFDASLYPWKTRFVPVSQQLGVPRVAYGHYVVMNAPTADAVGDPESIHLDWNFRAFRVGPAKLDTKKIAEDLKTAVPAWPIPYESAATAEPLKLTYLVLTVDDTKVANARQVIGRADAANRAVAELAKDAAITPGKVELVDAQLNDVKSAIRRTAGESAFQRNKRNPEAVEQLFALVDDRNLNDSDRTAVLDVIKSQLPPMSETFLQGVPEADGLKPGTLRRWYDRVKGSIHYDPQAGRYCVGSC